MILKNNQHSAQTRSCLKNTGSCPASLSFGRETCPSLALSLSHWAISNSISICLLSRHRSYCSLSSIKHSILRPLYSPFQGVNIMKSTGAKAISLPSLYAWRLSLWEYSCLLHRCYMFLYLDLFLICILQHITWSIWLSQSQSVSGSCGQYIQIQHVDNENLLTIPCNEKRAFMCS